METNRCKNCVVIGLFFLFKYRILKNNKYTRGSKYQAIPILGRNFPWLSLVFMKV